MLPRSIPLQPRHRVPVAAQQLAARRAAGHLSKQLFSSRVSMIDSDSACVPGSISQTPTDPLPEVIDLALQPIKGL